MSEVKVVAKNVRVAFPHLVTKHRSEKFPTAKPKFGINLLIHKRDNADAVNALQVAVKEVCKQHGWTEATLKGLPFVEAESIVKSDGSPLAGYDRDHLAVNAKSDNRPLVVDSDGTPLAGEEIESKIYGGCRCIVSFSVYAAKAYRKVCADLRAVKFYADDEPFGGRAPITDAASEFGDDDEDLL